MTSQIDYSKYTVIIPTLNEENTIGPLITILVEMYPGISIIIADDASTDNTTEIVKNYTIKNDAIHLLDRKNAPSFGLTASILDAVTLIKTPYCIVMDGDLQHPPEIIRKMISYFPCYDLVIGERRKVTNWRFDRKLMSYVATFLGKVRLVFSKNKAHDILSGFFAVKTELFQSTSTSSRYVLKGYKVLFDFLRIYPRPLRIRNVLYNFGFRNSGSSKIAFKHVLFYLKSLFK